MNFISRIKYYIVRLLGLGRDLDYVRINQGIILAEINKNKDIRLLPDVEYKVFSQWGEDGIIQYLIGNLEIRNKTFIEFGVEDFFESNCRFLLMKDHWRGFVVDGSKKNINRLKASYFYWQFSLNSEVAFISKDNIRRVLDKSGFDKDVGLLSIDIDGIDYHVLEALDNWTPSILIVEYNGVFGSKRPVSVPYDPEFRRAEKHHSNIYYGASLPAFVFLAGRRDFSLVGVNSAGSNAFFVRNSLLNDRVRAVTLEACYRDSIFREARDSSGNLIFLSGAERRRLILDLPLVDVETGEILKVQDLEISS